MTELKDTVIDARVTKTRDVLLQIVRIPYDQAIVIFTLPGDAIKFVGRLRTTLTRAKEKVASAGKSLRPITINVVEIITEEGHDKLTLKTQKTRSSQVDPLGDLVNELGMES